MNNRKSIHFTSDWHIGHANSIIFDSRPFRDLDHMHSVLINNYNAQVPENGVCYFLGDIGMTSSETLKKVITQLNGTKICILGNHDKAHNAMYQIGFDVVLNSATLYIAGERVTLSHCPLRGVFRESVVGMKSSYSNRDYKEGVPAQENWHGEHKNGKFSVSDEGQFHLHGHIHSSPLNDKISVTDRQFDVGVPANKYRPVHISVIESWITKNK